MCSFERLFSYWSYFTSWFTREKAAREAGVEESENEDDGDVVGGHNPFRKIEDQIVSNSYWVWISGVKQMWFLP